MKKMLIHVLLVLMLCSLVLVLPAAAVTNGKIAFTSQRDGNSEIYVMNADGSEQTRLTNSLDYELSPAWSPDGAKIAFGTFRDGNMDIYVMNADGTGQTDLTNSLTYDVVPDWSPDGSKIAYVSFHDEGFNNFEIYVMNVDGTGQTRLTFNTRWDGDPSWAPTTTPGSLEVKSSPSKAKIYIDGINTEQFTRWKFDDLSPGVYKVYVTLDGYATPATETVKVVSGQTASLHFKLDKLKKVK